MSMSRGTAAPTPYTRGEVSCANGAVTLAGTLLTPASLSGRHPAVVFVHGAGAGPRQAFNFLADRLARLGIASLIFDKRGSGSSTGDWRRADFGDLAGDALACVRVLKSRRDIDANRIGLVAQSQGGWIAPLAASMSRDVEFMILISGATVTPARQGWWTTEFRLRERGFQGRDIDEALALLKMDDEVTRTGRGLAELNAAVEHAKSTEWFKAAGFHGVPEPMRPFYRGFMDFNPLPVLQRLSIPIPSLKTTSPFDGRGWWLVTWIR